MAPGQGERKVVDINCDLGESFGAFQVGNDGAILSHVTSANVACGFHGGDPLVIHNTIRLAKEQGVAVGAHPSYPDLQGFGRRVMELTPPELFAAVVYQIGAVQAMAQAQQLPLQHAKPHGALSNQASVNRNLAQTIVEAMQAVDPHLILLAPFGSELEQAGVAAGLSVAREVFADRAYEANGTLRNRRYADALLDSEEQVEEHVLNMILEGYIVAVDGTRIPVKADSICIHGDGPNGPQFARRVRQALLSHGVDVRPLGETMKSPT